LFQQLSGAQLNDMYSTLLEASITDCTGNATFKAQELHELDIDAINDQI
jgi:hypothetical protein